jgi:hypothetical protein
MATKQTKKKKTTKKALLQAKSRFNLPTLVALVGVLSVVGYYVLTTFAAGPAHVSASCSKKVENDAQYACYRDSAEGWSTRIYRIVLDTNPVSTRQAYWSDQVNTKGVSPTVNAFITATNTAATKDLFYTRNANDKTILMYRRGLGREPDPSGKSYWAGRFAKEPAGDVVTAFLSTSAVKGFTNGFLAAKVLDYMIPGWRVTVVVPPACTECGCPNQPACVEPPGEPSEPSEPGPVDEPPAGNPDYSFVIPDDGSLDGGTDALPSLGEVSLDDLSSASEDDISKIIEEKTQAADGSVDNEAVARSYGGKLKILPPEEALSNGANEMRYYINGKLKATVKKAPYAYTLDSTRMKNGRYVLSIAAYQDGEKLDEYSYVLSVKNSLTFWQKIYNLISAPFAK